MTTPAAGLRCIAYDTAVLAMALRTLRHPTLSEHDLGRGTDQLAVEAALIKYRSLIDFLTGQSSGDDIKITEYGETPLSIANQERLRFRRSVNKYSAHLTWERTIKNRAVAEFPRPKAILKYGPLLLAEAHAFIARQLANGIRLNKYGQKYYATILDCLK